MSDNQVQIIEHPIGIKLVSDLAKKQFGDLIKATVDVDKGIMALGGELHADEEQLLLDSESKQRNLWGINLYPDNFGTEDFIQFDSMINIRPSQGNTSRDVQSPSIRDQISVVVGNLVIDDRKSEHAA